MTATARELRDFRQSQIDLVTLATRDLDAFWRTLDLSDAIGAARALEAFLPELVQIYGEIGVAVAADFYEEIRDHAPSVATAHNVLLADTVPIEQARASTRWAVGGLFTETPDTVAVLGNLIKVTDRLVKAPARDTLDLNVASDPAKPRFARVPTGTSTCPFCIMLASRGATYHSAMSGGVRSDLRRFHDHCDCVLVPVFGDQMPEGYDPQKYLDIYKRGLKESETGKVDGPEGALNQIRRQQHPTP